MYSKIDPALNEWIEHKSLYLQKEYKGEEVRSINYVTEKGNKYQIWLTPSKRNIVKITVWDYKKNKVVFEVENRFIQSSLNECISIINSWDFVML